MPNDALNNLLVAPGAVPDYTEITRNGGSWNSSVAAAQAPLTAVPTTVAGFEIFNNTQNVGSPVEMIIDQIFAFNLLGVVTVPSTAVLWAMVTAPKAVPSFTVANIFSNSGRALTVPTATSRIVTGAGTTVVANGWRPYGNPQSHAVAAATPGQSWSVELKGRLIVPPGCSLCLQVTTETISTNTYTYGASWVEAALLNMNNNQQ